MSPLRRSDHGPVFAEPWHAQVLALAFALTDEGLISPGEWAEALGAQLREAEARGAPDGDPTYYGAALAALEQLASQRGGISEGGLAERIAAWRRAYQRTPHGQPVELTAGLERDT